MKASQLLRGKRAVHRVRLPLCNLRCALLPDLPELAEQRESDLKTWTEEYGEAVHSDEVWVGVRALSGLEISDVLEKADASARARGCKDPKQGVPLYDLWYAIHVIEIACVDPDAKDPEAPEAKFFDGGTDQIVNSEHLGRDGILYLAEQQELWQDLVAPQAKRLNTDRLEELLDELAGPESLRFFGMLAPGLRWTCMRSMASLLLSARTLRSTPSSTTDDSTTTEETQPKRERSSKPKPAGGRRLRKRTSKRGK